MASHVALLTAALVAAAVIAIAAGARHETGQPITPRETGAALDALGAMPYLEAVAAGAATWFLAQFPLPFRGGAAIGAAAFVLHLAQAGAVPS